MADPAKEHAPEKVSFAALIPLLQREIQERAIYVDAHLVIQTLAHAEAEAAQLQADLGRLRKETTEAEAARSEAIADLVRTRDEIERELKATRDRAEANFVEEQKDKRGQIARLEQQVEKATRRLGEMDAEIVRVRAAWTDEERDLTVRVTKLRGLVTELQRAAGSLPS